MIEVKRKEVTKPDDWDTNPLYEKTYETEPLEVIYNEEELNEHIKQCEKVNEL